MDESEREQAFMSALVTEHFVLQSAASATISEAGSRAALYMAGLSSSLVALGFATQAPDVFGPMVAGIVPTVFLLGLFTVVRLVDTGVENVQLMAAIARIRAYYATLTPAAPPFFAPWAGGAGGGGGAARQAEALAMIGTRRRWQTGLSTSAAMVATINHVVAGAGVALLLHDVTSLAGAPSVVVGLLVAVLLTVAFLAYQNRRYTALEA
jgi:hypothetical protein